MNKPLDIYGNPVELGPWYWAVGRNNKVFGAGKFKSVISIDKILFYVGDTGYDTESFKDYWKVESPYESHHI